MNDIGTVDVQSASEKLVHEVLAVVICQVLAGVNDSVHVCLHQVGDDVDVLEALWGWWFLDINQTDNVLVVKELYIIDSVTMASLNTYSVI